VLLTLFSIVTSNPHLYDRLPFDPLKDFAPITALATSDSVLIAHPAVPAGTVKELIAHARANPGKLNYASAGKASPGHLTAEFFGRQTGTAFTHVPYKGNAEATLPFWYGMLAPAGTPREIVARLHAETVKALRDPQVDKTLRVGRIFPIGNTPEEFGAQMRTGHAAWGRVIRETGVKGE
jgi:tripartite-type tricarboxylate transporter receptor subunit TctC